MNVEANLMVVGGIRPPTTLDVSPTIAMNNVIYKTSGESEMLCNFKHSHLFGIKNSSDFQDGFIFNLGAFFPFVSAFSGTILHVLFPSPGRQVIRIHTSRIVAFVHHVISFGDFSNEVKICKSVDATHLSVEHKCAVSLRASCSIPSPAFSKFRAMRRYGAILINFFNESLVCSHKQETPTKHEVKPGQCSGNVLGRCKSLVSLFFAAALRPSELYHNRPYTVN